MRDARLSCPRCRSLLASVLVLLCGQPGSALAVAEDDQAGHCWWFRTDLAPGTVLDYEVTYQTAWGSAWFLQTTSSQSSFSLAVSEAEDGEARTVRLERRDAATQPATEASAWIEGLRNLNQQGVTLSGHDILVRESPLLKGPWCVGDRFTLGTAIVFFLRPMAAMVHAQVCYASAERVWITFEFWGGDPLPNSSGKGFVVVSSDRDGVRSILGRWLWNTPHGNLEALVTLRRADVFHDPIGEP